MILPLYSVCVWAEKEDRDLSCVISCLVQLMCDPHCRSLHGFQGLIQKEWVMAGHRFLDRCNHLKKSDKEEVVQLLSVRFQYLICSFIRGTYMWSKLILLFIFFLSTVSFVPAVPGLCVAAVESVPSSVWVHWGLPDSAGGQYVGPCLQHLPLQLPPAKSRAQQG